MKKNIAIIFGGDSSERVISEKSASVVQKHLSKDKYNTYLVEISQKGWFALINKVQIPINKDDFSFVKDGSVVKIEAIFNAIHGTPGEDGKLQGYFDMLQIPYNNSGVLQSSLTFNKWACNTFLKNFGISCAKSLLLHKNDQVNPQQIVETLGLPCFVKPNNGGSSFGASKVSKIEDLHSALNKAFEHDAQVVVEQYLKGTEVTSGVIVHNCEVLALPITEIVTENEFFDYEAKYKGASQEITPARVSEEITKKIQSVSKKVFTLLELKGMIRVDYIIVADEPHLIEVNTVPGLSEESIIPQQCRTVGISLAELFDGQVEQSLKK